MKYLLLIYDNEKRWSQGYHEAELGEYQAFGKEFAEAIKGGHALQPTSKRIAMRSATALARFMSSALLSAAPAAATRFGCCKLVISISNLVNSSLWR